MRVHAIMETAHTKFLAGGWLKLLCALCLVATMVPVAPAVQVAEADPVSSVTKSVMLGTSGIKGFVASSDPQMDGTWNTVYLGTYNNKTVKWRVLDAAHANNGEAGMFLLTDELQSTGNQGSGIRFENNTHGPTPEDYFSHQGPAPENGDHSNCKPANSWQGSDAQKWCQTYYGQAFSSQEQSAIKATTKSDERYVANPNALYVNECTFEAANNILAGDKVFFLSAQEVQNSSYGFVNFDAAIARYDGMTVSWWLRSPADVEGSSGEFVGYSDASAYASSSSSGYVKSDRPTSGTYPTKAVRPAMNLDSSKVLFTSAAGSAPATPTASAQLPLTSDYTGSDWKLTLLDSARNFAVMNTSTTAKKGETVQIAYAGATPGSNEYISAMIVDGSNSVLHYGQLSSVNAAAGTASLVVPSDLSYGTYTVRLFNEQVNSDNKANLASGFRDVTLNVVKETPTTSDFVFTPPATTPYEGSAKVATVSSSKSGMGAITVKYYQGDAEVQPIAVGTYTVKIDVAEGADYTSATGITDSAWTFAITKGASQAAVASDMTAAYGDILQLKAEVKVNPNQHADTSNDALRNASGDESGDLSGEPAGGESGEPAGDTPSDSPSDTPSEAASDVLSAIPSETASDVPSETPSGTSVFTPQAADPDQVDFFLREGNNETLLGSAGVVYQSQALKDTGTATLAIDTTQKTIPLGSSTIVAQYGGSVNLNDSNSNTITLTLNPKPVGFAWTGAADRVYDGKPSNVGATVTGVAPIDGSLSVTVTGGTATNAGTYTATATDLFGECMQFYTLPVSPTTQYKILPATPIENPAKKTTARLQRGATLAQANVSEGELWGIDRATPLRGSFAWENANRTPTANGAERMVFTPVDPNYTSLVLSVAVSLYPDAGGGSGSGSGSGGSGASNGGNAGTAGDQSFAVGTQATDNAQGASSVPQLGDTVFGLWPFVALMMLAAGVGVCTWYRGMYRSPYAGKHSAPRKRLKK